MRGGTGQAPAVFGTSSRGCFKQVLAWLEGNESATLSHGELEGQLRAAAGSCYGACCRTT